MLRLLRIGLVFSLLIANARAFADSPSDSTETEPLHPAWVIPLAPLAVIAPGSGHYFRRDYSTSDQLYKYGGYSFLTFLASGLILGLSGAADQTIVPFIPLAMGGAAGWLAFASIDIVGSTLSKSTPNTYPSQWKEETIIGLEHVSVKSPIFSANSYSGVVIRHQGHMQKLQVKGLSSDIGNIERYSLDYGKTLMSRLQENQGLALHFKIIHEINPQGFFNMTTLEPSLGLSTDASLFAPGLERIFFNAKFGLQQHVVQYKHGAGGGNETDSSMVGSFDTSWSAYSWLKPSFGYRHERESLVATETTGFVGVFYAASEFHFLEQYYLNLRSYLSAGTAWDISLSKAF